MTQCMCTVVKASGAMCLDCREDKIVFPQEDTVVLLNFPTLLFLQKELIREVEMGPFKHTVDDGLDLRKAAFECMYTLMETCLEQLDVFQFLSHIEDGLKDHYDIRVSCSGQLSWRGLGQVFRTRFRT